MLRPLGHDEQTTTEDIGYLSRATNPLLVQTYSDDTHMTHKMQ